jgi:hypothetical protein
MSFMASMMQMVWPLVTRSPSFTNSGSPGAGERYRVPAMGATISMPAAGGKAEDVCRFSAGACQGSTVFFWRANSLDEPARRCEICSGRHSPVLAGRSSQLDAEAPTTRDG